MNEMEIIVKDIVTLSSMPAIQQLAYEQVQMLFDITRYAIKGTSDIPPRIVERLEKSQERIGIPKSMFKDTSSIPPAITEQLKDAEKRFEENMREREALGQGIQALTLESIQEDLKRLEEERLERKAKRKAKKAKITLAFVCNYYEDPNSAWDDSIMICLKSDYEQEDGFTDEDIHPALYDIMDDLGWEETGSSCFGPHTTDEGVYGTRKKSTMKKMKKAFKDNGYSLEEVEI